MRVGEVWAIEWIDSESRIFGWERIDGDEPKWKLSRMMAVGHVVDIDDERVVLSWTVDPKNGDCNNGFAIPLSVIKKKKKISAIKNGQWVNGK